MKWLLWIGLVLVALVAGVAVIGWLLPVAHTASRSMPASTGCGYCS
jgi:hypothetical protein